MSEEIQKTEEVKPEIKKPVIKEKSPWRKRLILIALGVVLILGVIGYFKYYFVYSEGTRVGILYKFSKKGTFFKTYEGEMVLPGIRTKGTDGMNSNMFHFSVTDEELANILKVSTRTIDRYRDQGMPYYRCNWRGLIGFELEEVKAWLRGE